MTFMDFCRLHGVTLNSLPPIGRWVRVPTDDKPRSRNGAVKFMGQVGFVQNWATMTEPATWRAEGESTQAVARARQVVDQAAREARQNAQKAAQKALVILGECELAPHPYLASKGFPDELGNVWNRETDNVLVIPMRIGSEIVGCQLIKPEGDKKFLFGQRSGGAEFVMGQRGSHVLCEGYATALSVRAALQNIKVSYVLHVGFSAGNLKRLAANLPSGVIVADNDASKTGERVAQEIGWSYWLSEQVGEDFNDFHQRVGLFAASMSLKRVLQDSQRRRA